jgi:hypothetical protein
MQRTFTEVNIFDPEICELIEDHMRYLWNELESAVQRGELKLKTEQVNLVLELKNSDTSASPDTVCWYYFVNHNSRCLFWLHESDVKDVLSDCKGVESLAHIRRWIIVVGGSGSDDLSCFSLLGLAIQAQYWCVLGKVRTILLTTPSHS